MSPDMNDEEKNIQVISIFRLKMERMEKMKNEK